MLNNTILSLVVDSLTDSPRKTSVYTLAQKKKMPIDIKPSPHGHIDIEMHFISVQQITWLSNHPCTQIMGLDWGIRP